MKQTNSVFVGKNNNSSLLEEKSPTYKYSTESIAKIRNTTEMQMKPPIAKPDEVVADWVYELLYFLGMTGKHDAKRIKKQTLTITITCTIAVLIHAAISHCLYQDATESATPSDKSTASIATPVAQKPAVEVVPARLISKKDSRPAKDDAAVPEDVQDEQPPAVTNHQSALDTTSGVVPGFEVKQRIDTIHSTHAKQAAIKDEGYLTADEVAKRYPSMRKYLKPANQNQIAAGRTSSQ